MPRSRFCGGSAATSMPSIAIAPRLGWTNPATIMSVVVLPEPLGPRSVKNDPAGTVMETSRSEEHTSELQSRLHLVCRLLLEKKKKKNKKSNTLTKKETYMNEI